MFRFFFLDVATAGKFALQKLNGLEYSYHFGEARINLN